MLALWAMGVAALALVSPVAATPTVGQTYVPPFAHLSFVDGNVTTISGYCSGGQTVGAHFSSVTGRGGTGDVASCLTTNSVSSAYRGDGFDLDFLFKAPTGIHNITVNLDLNWTARANVSAGNCSRTVGTWHLFECYDSASWSISAHGALRASKVNATRPWIREIASNASWLGVSNLSSWDVYCPKGHTCIPYSTAHLDRGFGGHVSLNWTIEAALNGSRSYVLVLATLVSLTSAIGEVYGSYGTMSGLSATVELNEKVQLTSITIS